MRRLVLASRESAEQRAFLLGWSCWRRAHQAGARRCHTARDARERSSIPLSLPASSPLGPRPRGALTDREWDRLQPLLPPQKPAKGRPPHDHRTLLNGILWVLRTPAPWREMPAEFGKANTAFVRYRLWRRQGLWQRIIDALGPEASPPPVMARAPSS